MHGPFNSVFFGYSSDERSARPRRLQAVVGACHRRFKAWHERSKRAKETAHEALEPRRFLSAYTATALASFSEDVGASPLGGVIMDSAGNLYGTASRAGGAAGDGSIFEVAKDSGAITPLALFDSNNGLFPNAGLVMDSAGDLFGTTPGFLNYSLGDVFELSKGSAAVAILGNFNGKNGSAPLGALIVDSAGNLYGTASEGGLHGDGTVFEVSRSNGAITTLADATAAEKMPSSELVMDSAGNLYGTDQQGGDNGVGSVFELAKGSTTLTNLASFNTTDGADPIAGLVMDSAGNLYGTTVSGGSANFGTVFEIASGSGVITTLGAFDGTNGAAPQSTLLMDGAGDLFGTTTGGITMTGTFFEVVKDSGTITALAAFPPGGSAGATPQGTLSADATGNFYGAATSGGANNTGTVFELSPTVAAVPAQVAFAAPPSMVSAGAVLNPPVVVNVEDSDGNVVAADNSTVTLSIASGPSGATLGGTVSEAAVNGVATFSDLSLSQPGAYTFTATDGSLAPATTGAFNVAAPSTVGAASLAFTGTPSAGIVGTALAPAVVVSVEDASGNVVSTDASTVTLSIASGPAGAALGGTVSQTAVNGVATFPDLTLSAAGAYTLSATDGSLTPAASTAVTITAPVAASPLGVSFGAVRLAPAVVAGAKLKAKAPVVVTNSGGAFTGSVTVNIDADTGESLDGNQTPIAMLTKKVSLKTGKGKVFNFMIKALPAGLADGTYHLLAEVVDPAGLTNVTTTTQTVQVAAAFIQPAAVVGAVTPSAVASGKSASLVVTVTNNGNVAAGGIDLMLSPSADGATPLAGVILDSVRSGARILPNKSKTFKLRFKIPAGVAAGTYFPYVAVTLGGVSTTAAGAASFTVG